MGAFPASLIPGDLQERMLKYENTLIKQALTQANGSVTETSSLTRCFLAGALLDDRVETQRSAQSTDSNPSPREEDSIRKDVDVLTS